jgi:endonuclease-3 related protein
MDDQSLARALTGIYRRLFSRFGPQHWWPAEEPFEVIVGAILTQSAAWTNVEKAIINLKKAGVLSAAELRRISAPRLARLIRPCGYYNAKALKLKSFAFWLGNHYSDDLDSLFASNTDDLRQQLLSVHGIGPETADSILLYAAVRPVFVVDAYTRRIFGRIGLIPEKDSYAGCQAFFMDNLPADTALFNEYHALLVRLGKEACRRRPLCAGCCLSDMCKFANLDASLSVG